MNIYTVLSNLFPTRPPPAAPRRMLLILPCCIGDVVLATAALKALRRAYPKAHITWAVGGWSKGVVDGHDLLDDVLDTGPSALPLKNPGEMLRFVRQIRGGHFDLLVSLVRSPLMSIAALLSSIPCRAGLDSGGRGFGYNIRAPIDPSQPRHEADVYLDVPRALGLNVTECWANVPVRDIYIEAVQKWLIERGVVGSFMLVNPCGGRNPGMVMDVKRWPPEHFAALADHLSARLGMMTILMGGPGDEPIVKAVKDQMRTAVLDVVGGLSFWQIATMAKLATVYIGNDTGLTHLAAAAGGRTAMILGPSDPVRYAPFTPDSIALWRPTAVIKGGVAQGVPENWDWSRDGISVEEVETKIVDFLASSRPASAIT
ncbi:MAG: glycosyltransferase family 9 protein [Anaerolineae bacterium]|nr:glycosyltransferase family 9 protein [Anaerolineae bacterium]